MQFVCEEIRSRQDRRLVRMRRAAPGPLRSPEGQGKLEPRLDSERSIEHVAIRSGAAGFEAVGDRLAGRGNDAADQYEAAGKAPGRERSVGKRRGRESHGIIQGPWTVVRDFDGCRAGCEKSRDSVCGKCGGRDGGVRGGGGNRSAYLHAARRSAIELHRMPRRWREGHAGQRADQRLRKNRRVAQGCRRLVRRFDAEGAVSHRRKENDGIRGRRAVPLAASRRNFLSGRRGRRHDRDVEGVCGDEALGWIGPKRPKMIAVQAAGCAPIVRAFEQGKERSEFFENAETVASGLRVPKALGDFLVLNAVRESGGTAVAVSDEEMIDAGIELASDEGIFAAPEGGACVAALKKLLASGFLKADERIVIYNTGSGLKYLEAYSPRFPR